ncbi:MAG: PilZ domain-containing protein [candidate division KSB1 bacterium]|jgi:hypothetical protein|nr:PilZ domain-containing protein [candidate division KSB1 bacterium]
MERRAHPRLYPKKQSEQPKVIFHFNRQLKIAVNTINISTGGMMGYTPSIEHFLGIEDQHIKKVEIAFPNKKKILCSGKILRVQPVLSENRCYCAVEFGDIEKPDKQRANKAVSAPVEVVESTDEREIDEKELLDRLKSLGSYGKTRDIDVEEKIFQKALAVFADVTKNLTAEEKWFFHDLLDEMKRKEPDYPPALKKAFLKLCRTGLIGEKEKRPRVLRQPEIMRRPVRSIQ